jgi:hypothetical protein
MKIRAVFLCVIFLITLSLISLPANAEITYDGDGSTASSITTKLYVKYLGIDDPFFIPHNSSPVTEVSDLSLNTTYLPVGGTVNITWRMRNVGTTGTISSTLRIYFPDGTPVPDDQVCRYGNVESGASVQCSVHVRTEIDAPEGKYNVGVDDQGIFESAVLTSSFELHCPPKVYKCVNNDRYLCWWLDGGRYGWVYIDTCIHGCIKTDDYAYCAEPPPAPDLTLSSSDITFSSLDPDISYPSGGPVDYGTAHLGTGVRLNAVIHNIGDVTATADVAFYDGSILLETKNVEVQAGGQTNVFTDKWERRPTGYHSIRVVIEELDEESDTTNNEATRSVEVCKANEVVVGVA